MIFVLSYSPATGETRWIGEFDDGQMREAQNARLKAELSLKPTDAAAEIVVLTAENRDSLRKTHGRYFRDTHDALLKSRGRLDPGK